MGKIRIESKLRLINPDKEESFSRRYAEDGALIETRVTCRESDYMDGCWDSPDLAPLLQLLYAAENPAYN